MSKKADSDEITSVVLICDESGAKGYADKDEEFPGDVGVFAGLFASKEKFSAIQHEFNAVALRYVMEDGKLHIADLGKEEQGTLRKEMFALILKHGIPCFWEAIHVAGFHGLTKKTALLLSGPGKNQSPV
jgi:hypothetical protein